MRWSAGNKWQNYKWESSLEGWVIKFTKISKSWGGKEEKSGRGKEGKRKNFLTATRDGDPTYEGGKVEGPGE